MNSAWIVALIVGALIIAGLAFYAGKLLWQLKVQKEVIAKYREKKAKELEESRQARNGKIADSVNLIARAMREKQCEYSEGCLRVWVLISQYSFDEEVDLQQAYPGVFKMYEEVKEMPTHEARKKYSKKEIFKMDSQRWRAEERLEQEILADCDNLIVRFKAAPGSENVVFQ